MKLDLKRSLISASVVAACSFGAAAHATNGYFSNGYSTASLGLAGAGEALPQDAMAAATNPAGMVWVGDQLDLSLALFSPLRSYKADMTATPMAIPTSGYVKSKSNLFFIPGVGYNHMLNPDMSVGITAYGNGGMNTDYPSNNPNMGGGVSGAFGAGSAGVNLSQLFIAPSFSQKFDNNRASWGASLILAYQQFSAKGLQPFEYYSTSPNNVTNNGNDTSTGVGVNLGVMFKVTPGFTVGANYQPKITMSKFKKYQGLFANGGEFDIPGSYGVGMAWKVVPNGTLAFDVQEIDYSNVASIANKIQNVLSCSPANSSFCLGGSNGPGFGWQNMTVYKLGYQWTTGPDWTWRVGYSHAKQPIPSDQVLFNILAPATVEDQVTFGFTKAVGKNQSFDFAAMYAPSHTVSGNVPALLGGQHISFKMTEYQLQGGYTWKF